MILKKLGKTGIQLSAVGLGAWAIGGGDYKFGWGAQDDQMSIDTIRRAVDLGINWIDTAPIYGSGHSEKVVGQALDGIRDKVFVSTKCGLKMAENNEDIDFDLSSEGIRKELEESLKNLKTDVIDLYMIHKPVPEDQIEMAWSTLNDLIKEGKIRFAGVSSFTIDQLKKVHSAYPVSFFQPGYNMLDRSIEGEILEFCGQNEIGVVVFSPMCSGLLTGKFTKESITKLPDDDWRRSASPYFQPPQLDANLQLIEDLQPIAEKNNKTIAQLAISWAIRLPEVTSAIVGARKPSQIEQTAPAGHWELSTEDIEKIERVLEKHANTLANL